jgi:hypothetical protein
VTTKNESGTVFVTDDKWVLNGGVLDETDVEAQKEASTDLKFVLMSSKQMLEHLSKHDPEKMEKIRGAVEQRAGVRITSLEQLLSFARQADSRMKEFDGIVKRMTVNEARLIRKLRVNMRHSWRSVAWEVYKWHIFDAWQPPSNQLAGMALCDRAAKLLGENYRQEPWN